MFLEDQQVNWIVSKINKYLTEMKLKINVDTVKHA